MDAITAAELAAAVTRCTERLTVAGQPDPAGLLTEQLGTGDTARAQRAVEAAYGEVGAHLGTPATVDLVPLGVLRQAVLLVASQVWHAQDAPHGVANWADDGAAPVRVSRDPMTAARPLLRRYVGLGIA